MRFVFLVLVLASRAASAQIAPGSSDSPAQDRNPSAPPARSETPDTSTEPPVEGPPSTDDVPPIPVVPQPPPEEPKAPPEPREPPTQVDPTTSLAWEPRYRFDWHWQILRIPERAIELVFLPLGLLVSATDTYRLDKRLKDLLALESLGLKISPRFKFSLGDGAGAGLWIKRKKVFNWAAYLRAGGLIRIDRDWQVELDYGHALLLPGGRGLRARAYVERDKNQRFYGIGASSIETDRRVLADFQQGLLLEMDLQGIDRYTVSGVAQLGLRRQHLTPGIDPGGTAVMLGDTVAPPPGFDVIATYLDARLVGRYDTRDTVGRPTKGIEIEASALGRADVTGKNLSATTLSLAGRVHLPLLPDHRVLVLTVAGAAAVPLFPGDDKPLDSLPVIGRSNLRGYDRERFRDRYVVMASAEYRFPIYEYLSSNIGLDAFTFVDVGTIWGVDKLSLDEPRYSFGGGIRGAAETKLLFEATLGWSPEGPQFNIGVESAL